MKNGAWRLSDLDNIPKNGRTVFSCFHCGGGSTMGYKLSGFTVLGGVEIDPQMMAIYRANHRPLFSYLMGIQDFNKKDNAELPPELFTLDVLDGSPPCSSFSMAGQREDKWGKAYKFREGQAHQVLDDLFFSFIETAKKLKPKVVVSENVKGLVSGNARGYVKLILKSFELAGYDTQIFLLNASRMGVPQRRERVFFISRRKDLNLPSIKLNFKEPEISVSSAFIGTTNKGAYWLGDDTKQKKYWQASRPGVAFEKAAGGGWFSHKKIIRHKPMWTLTAGAEVYHDIEPRLLSPSEFCRIQTFPDDFNFLDAKPGYVAGMSVPPYMMNRLADNIFTQLLA